MTLAEIIEIASADPTFIASMTSNEIWYGNNATVRITDVIAAIAQEVQNRADANHTHSGYAPSSHTHDGYAATNHAHAEYAANNHSHAEYSETNHTHTGFAESGHTHTPASIGAAPAAHTHDYADGNHTHTPESIGAADSNHFHSYNDLTNKPTIPEEYMHPESHPASMITGLANVAQSGSYNDLTDKPTIPTVPATLPANGGNADTVDDKHASDFAAADHSHVGFSGTSASTYKMVYVATDGSDENDGTSTSKPMATIKGAVRKYAEKYKMLDIRLADGTYNEDLGTFAVDQCNMSIRSLSSDKNAVTINSATALDSSLPELRLYNLTLNITATNIRAVCVNAGILYAYGVRLNVPTGSTASCLNVYNGSNAFIMDSILNSGTANNSGAAVYGNQAHSIKAINCTSERTVRVGFHAHNGSDIIYTDTLTATTKTKVTSWGKCTERT